jgi:hypothetical protein
MFIAAVFVLTAVGLALLYYNVLALNILSLWIYLVAVVLVFGFATDYFLLKNKLSGKKFLLLTFGLIIISATITQTFATIVTPSWSFSVYTDKSTYSLGENVTITACLKNTGLITHSFESFISDPILFNVGEQDWYIHGEWTYWTIWCSPVHSEDAQFSVGPKQILQRTSIWNQTYTEGVRAGRVAEPGQYRIGAWIGDTDANLLFSAKIYINITST